MLLSKYLSHLKVILANKPLLLHRRFWLYLQCWTMGALLTLKKNLPLQSLSMSTFWAHIFYFRLNSMLRTCILSQDRYESSILVLLDLIRSAEAMGSIDAEVEIDMEISDDEQEHSKENAVAQARTVPKVEYSSAEKLLADSILLIFSIFRCHVSV